MTNKCPYCKKIFEHSKYDIMADAAVLFGEFVYCPDCGKKIELGVNIPYGFEHIVSDLKRGLIK